MANSEWRLVKRQRMATGETAASSEWRVANGKRLFSFMSALKSASVFVLMIVKRASSTKDSAAFFPDREQFPLIGRLS
jgi:hypothetical protein